VYFGPEIRQITMKITWNSRRKTKVNLNVEKLKTTPNPHKPASTSKSWDR